MSAVSDHRGLMAESIENLQNSVDEFGKAEDC